MNSPKFVVCFARTSVTRYGFEAETTFKGVLFKTESHSFKLSKDKLRRAVRDLHLPVKLFWLDPAENLESSKSLAV